MDIRKIDASKTQGTEREDTTNSTQSYVLRNNRCDKDIVEISTKPKRQTSFMGRLFPSLVKNYKDSSNLENEPILYRILCTPITFSFIPSFKQKTTTSPQKTDPNDNFIKEEAKNILNEASGHKKTNKYTNYQKELINEYIKAHIEAFKSEKEHGEIFDSVVATLRYSHKQLNKLTDKECQNILPFIKEKVELKRALDMAGEDEDIRNLALQYIQKNNMDFADALCKAEREISAGK